MYYLYLITNLKGRAGFGISADYRERNQQYASHSGDIVKFSFLYGGIRAHAKAVERTIKTQYVDNIWMLDDWKTEWLKDNITMSELKMYVDTLITERYFRIKLVAEEYDFTQGTLDLG